MAEEMGAGRLRQGESELAARQFLSLCQAGCFYDVIWHRPSGPSSTPDKDIDAAVDAFLRIWNPAG
jgi:hypothetical protein